MEGCDRMTEIIGWIGNICFFMGITLIARKHRVGFHYNSGGNLCYLIQSIIMDNISLVVLSLALIGLNIYGYWNWRKK